MSGGLDSALAAKVVKAQGVEVVGLHLVSPFGCHLDVDKVATTLGIRLIKKEKGEAYLDLVQNPQFGYGKNMNPCIDCRIYMFKLASRVMQDEKADFVVTGEVLGQRPMSQMRNSMNLIDSRSGLGGRCLRPLSAKHLEPTVPELEGWVDRSKLFAMAGRGRKDQFGLAEKIGVTQYAAPGGGCLLTESAFSKRLSDFYTYDRTAGEIRLARAQLLRLGRHFRWSKLLKVVVGRDQSENSEISTLWRKADAHYFHPKTFNGPDAVAMGEIGDDDIIRIGGIIARYAGLQSRGEISWEQGERTQVFDVRTPIADTDLALYRL